MSEDITPPSFKRWSETKIYDYDSQIIDYNSLDELNEAISKARRALFVLSSKINICEREEKIAHTNYDRNFRRFYLESSEKTESAKKARAAIKCEDLENQWLMYEQLHLELQRMATTVRDELRVLENLGHNLRLQLKT